MAAATRKGKSILFTAVTDTYAAQAAIICGITFQGSGLSTGDRILLLDDGDDIVADAKVTSTTLNLDLWNGRDAHHMQGLKMSGTVDGTWVLTVFLH